MEGLLAILFLRCPVVLTHTFDSEYEKNMRPYLKFSERNLFLQRLAKCLLGQCRTNEVKEKGKRMLP